MTFNLGKPRLPLVGSVRRGLDKYDYQAAFDREYARHAAKLAAEQEAATDPNAEINDALRGMRADQIARQPGLTFGQNPDEADE